jgi:hypothetical protein
MLLREFNWKKEVLQTGSPAWRLRLGTSASRRRPRYRWLCSAGPSSDEQCWYPGPSHAISSALKVYAAAH